MHEAREVFAVEIPGWRKASSEFGVDETRIEIATGLTHLQAAPLAHVRHLYLMLLRSAADTIVIVKYMAPVHGALRMKKTVCFTTITFGQISISSVGTDSNCSIRTLRNSTLTIFMEARRGHHLVTRRPFSSRLNLACPCHAASRGRLTKLPVVSGHAYK